MKRESFGSRLGFILVSAGCAIGLGNVWKFPYICGAYGGAAFILIYLLFLVILGIPVLVCEFAVGRGSRKSVAKSFDVLAPEGTTWSLLKYIGMAGCYLLMMFY
ncbi:MAG: sodium-dependent transporter, partial [Lachnospiraceae bacterium]